MLNTVAIMGRITADPELKTTPSGVSVTSFKLAVERNYAPQGKERPTDFIPVVAWRNTAEFITKYFAKGQMIAVSGSIQSRQYEDKDGNKRTAVEVLANEVSFCGSKNDSKPADIAPIIDEPRNAYSEPAPAENIDFEEIMGDDDLPF